MRIDLHCHTKKTKKGDGAGRNVTPQQFREKLALADVRIVALTNHNAFDVQQYNVLKETVCDFCLVWPGIEIDVNETSRFHLIVISNPDNVEEFVSRVMRLFEGDDIDSCEHSLKEICSTFAGLNVIYISHYHNKRPAISDQDHETLKSLVDDGSCVFIEPRDYKTLGVLASNELNAIIGSDVKDWNKYEDCTFAELRLPVASFQEFCLLAKRDSVVVDSLLSKKTPTEVVAHPYNNVSIRLKIFPDVNIVFGQKGTGKTEIVKSILSQMVSDGKRCNRYFASENNNDFSAFKNIHDMELDLSKVDADPCNDAFILLKNWHDASPTKFSQYLDWAKTRDNSTSKSRMKITDAIHDNYVEDPSFSKHKTDLDAVLIGGRKLHCVTFEDYMSETDASTLRTLLQVLHQQVLLKRKQDLFAYYASKLTNYSIDKIKELADKNSDTASRPSVTGLRAFAEQRIQLFRSLKAIIRNMSKPEHNEVKRIGTLEDKGAVFVNYKYRMLCAEETTTHYPGQRITVLRQIQKEINELADNVLESDTVSRLAKLNDDCVAESVESLKPFLARSKQIVTEDRKEYTPSNGEQAVLLLQKTLRDDADAYFLDEPELGMGNSYIDATIRPLISDLARRRKYVIIATHNANIAVRTLPYMSVLRTHENGVYMTYTGNPFDDRLVNINDESDIKSWSDESLHCLEGGRDAFYGRRDIYESK